MKEEIKSALLFLKSEEKAKLKSRYFKGKEGEYGAGDTFIGLSNPEVQAICKEYREKLTVYDLTTLIQDPIHEFRFAALTILVWKYKKAKTWEEKTEIVDFYLKNINYINNWDLVDCSCHFILGPYYFDKKEYSVLLKLAKSDHLWSERIAVISSLYFIRNGYYTFTFEVVTLLLEHNHDLIHKANGWMLREIWKREGKEVVEDFIKTNIRKMPRTTLRYAIEKMEDVERKQFLNL